MRYVALVALVACQPQSAPEETTPAARGADSTPPRAECHSAAADSKWSYVTESDKMRGTTTSAARLISEPVGSIRAAFGLEATPTGDAVVLGLSGAAFGCFERDSFGETPCHFAFRAGNDDYVHEGVGFLLGDRNATMTLGIRNAPSTREWIRRMCKSTHLIVELPIFEHGRVQFEFSPGGLQWPPPEHAAPQDSEPSGTGGSDARSGTGSGSSSQ